nr:NADH dehydrogenase subunit 4 [Histampica sp. CS049]
MVLFLIVGVSITLWLCPINKVWGAVLSQSIVGWFLVSGSLFSSGCYHVGLAWGLGSDDVSSVLISLSFWLLPVSLIASVGHLRPQTQNVRFFSQLCLFIIFSLVITFSATNLLVLFLGFEMTLVPTLLLITRWGAQQERVEAGSYFVFYTLSSSLPLFVCLLLIYLSMGHGCISLFELSICNNLPGFVIFFCFIAFLVKVPIFGLHLWLPKAHVEAPVAGSMILAAVLLKMGGYGFIRLTSIFYLTFQNSIAPVLIPFCCWGGLLTSLICLTQTDLKSLIAYSSVSHMSLMIAGTSSLSCWGYSGCVIIMVAHGVISSGLFYCANLYYERTGTRTLNISRGLKLVFVYLPVFWLFLACANLGFPPFLNAVGELFIFSAVVSYHLVNYIPIALSALFTSIFSLSIYQMLNSGQLYKWNVLNMKMSEREVVGVLLHIGPTFGLIFLPSLLCM